ncbi:MAG: type II toxin-antitoxin system RelE/ParE family toxin [Bacteroidota bacterium]
MNEKTIEIIFLKPAENFLDNIDTVARLKLAFSMRKTKSRLFGDWFKKMAGTKGLFEFRVEYQGKCFRIFAFWDSREKNQALIVCTHGFFKKTNRTPKSEIIRAEQIKQQYFNGLI